MAKYFKPRRGTKGNAEGKLTGGNALKSGEFFVEYPTAGAGKGSTGEYGLKMGDGSTAYASLPYIVAPGVVYNVAATTITYSAQGTTSRSSDSISTINTNISTLLNTTGNSGKTLATILGAFKTAILSCGSGLTKLNNDLGNYITKSNLINFSSGSKSIEIGSGNTPVFFNLPCNKSSFYIITAWFRLRKGNAKLDVAINDGYRQAISDQYETTNTIYPAIQISLVTSQVTNISLSATGAWNPAIGTYYMDCWYTMFKIL